MKFADIAKRIAKFLKMTTEYAVSTSLNVCEYVGNAVISFTKWGYGAVAPYAARIAGFVSAHAVNFAKRWKRTLVQYGRMIAAGVRTIGAEAFAHAKEYGVRSGLAKFFGGIRRGLSSNKDRVGRVLNHLSPIAALVLVIVVLSSFTNITLAYEVKYSGESIGYVSDAKVYDEASDIVASQLDSDSEELTTEPVFALRLVKADALVDAGELSDAIIDTSDEVCEAYGVYVDGEFVGAVSSDRTAEVVLNRLKTGEMEKYSCDNAEILNEVRVEHGVYYADTLHTTVSMTEILSGVLSIRTLITTTKDTVLEYATVTAKDSTKYEGYKRVTVNGENGLSRTTYEAAYINGELVSNEAVSVVTVKAPVDEQVIVGTRKLATVDIEVNADYAWPVARVSRSYVSQYFGHEGHTGIDICAPSGTQIYAAQSGTVVDVEYSYRGYGYNFTVDCGNGIYNLYAHCSSIDVSVGQKIVMGQEIAKVGSTGNSTGPHLHFEVIKNGVQVNPAPYLGVN